MAGRFRPPGRGRSISASRAGGRRRRAHRGLSAPGHPRTASGIIHRMQESSGEELAHAPREEPAHDILAAEAFAVPTPDPSLRDEPVVLPDDPSGITEPHDILAAEEFAM